MRGAKTFKRLTCFSIMALSALLFANAQHSDQIDDFIEDIERQMVMPDGAEPITAYNRFYGFSAIGDIDVVKGVYLIERHQFDPKYLQFPATKRGTFVISDGKFPVILDGGCSVVTVYYRLDDRELIPLQYEGRDDIEPQLGICNGRA